ncbi:acyltransferase domain-containing protein, partial [Streptomyces sp. SID625]|nr:acyltransferase domain-containing protein [Streptomyces sp. SID625]
VPLPQDRMDTLLKPWAGRLSVAAVNGPAATVLSGDADAIEEVRAQLVADGVRARTVPVDFASHSSHVEAVREELTSRLAGVRPRASRIPFYSTVTAQRLDTRELDEEYWYRNLRGTVRFEETTRALLEARHTVFVEVSPHPVLTIGIQDTVDAADAAAVVSGTLRRDKGGLAQLFTSAGRLFTAGVHVDWAGVFAGTGAAPVELPPYVFQRERYW